MILYLIRHPRPLVAPGVCYGRLDVPAEGGEAVAERLRRELPAGLPVWTSPLVRCRQLAERLHPEPIPDERLAEMHFGEWEGQPWEEIGAAALDAWAADVAGFAPPGGESAAALQARVLDFVAELCGLQTLPGGRDVRGSGRGLPEPHRGEFRRPLARMPCPTRAHGNFLKSALLAAEGGRGAVLVTHAGVIRVLLAHWRNLPPERWTEIRPDYGGLIRVRIEAGGAVFLDALPV